MFIIGKLLAAFLLPPGMFILLAIIAVIYMFRGRMKAFIILFFLDAILFYAFSTCALSSLLIAPLENEYTPLASRTEARAIIVLGGAYGFRWVLKKKKYAWKP